MINIRPFDLLTIDHIVAHSPVRDEPRARMIMKECVLRSEQSWSGAVGDEVVCVWGLIPPTLMSDQAYIWLLTTEAIEDHKFAFVRHSQLVIEKALKEYDKIVGDVMAVNWPARQWLGWLGAEFGPKGQSGEIPFVIKKRIS